MSADQPSTARRIAWPLAIAETVAWAALFYSFPALLPEWERDLGWSKTELSAAFTMALVAAAVLAPIWGRVIDRGYGRYLFTGGALLGGALLVLLSRVTELWEFYCVWIGIGVAASACLYEACFAVVTVMLGGAAKRTITLITLVGGFAGTLSFPAASVMIELADWRAATLMFAGAIVVIGAPLIWIGARDAGAVPAETEPETVEESVGRTRVIARPTFWLLALAFAMISLGHGAVITHMLPIMADRGLRPETAVLAASMIGPMQVAGRLAMMAVEAHVKTIGIAMTTCVTMGVAAAALLAAGAAPGLVVAFVVLHGAGYGVTSITRPVVIGELLGRKGFGVTSGMIAFAHIGATAAAPTVAALIWGVGGYTLVLTAAIAGAGIGFAALFAAWRISLVKTG